LISISIITATYNAAETLPHCINSVAGQSIAAEHIIVDGGSTDNTPAVIDRYKTQFSRVISEPDQGIYDALNKGIKLATGDVVGVLHADDYYPHPDVLKGITDTFAHTTTATCYGDLDYVRNDDHSRVVRKWRSGEFEAEKFYWGWMPPHPTFFIRREYYEKYGLYNLDLGSAADYELMLRYLLKHRLSTVYIPQVLVHMRTGGVSNRSIRNRLRANRMDRKAWEVNGLRPYPWTTWIKPVRKIPQWIIK